MQTITIVTGNPGKVKEIQSLAPPSLDFKMRALDLPEIQSLDTKEIVIDKLKRAYEIAKTPVIVEDVSTGLDNLSGLPGPFFKFFEQKFGKRALPELAKTPNESVTIICTAGYYDGERMLFSEGVLHGTIVEPRGENGFGFDFTVVPDGETRTMAEMTSEEKNTISHRSKAFRDLVRQLKDL